MSVLQVFDRVLHPADSKSMNLFIFPSSLKPFARLLKAVFIPPPTDTKGFNAFHQVPDLERGILLECCEDDKRENGKQPPHKTVL